MGRRKLHAGTPDATEATITKTKLSRNEFYRLCLSLSAQSKELLQEKPPLDLLADRLTEKLGFMVQKGHVKQAMAATEIDWKSSSSARLTALCATATELGFSSVEAALADLALRIRGGTA